MHIKKGHNRVVLVFPTLKFVVKFPIISFYQSCLGLIFYVETGNWKLFKEEFRSTTTVEKLGSLKYYLLRGLCANWGEFKFYRRTKNPFLQPTYFSFFGFLNIQRCDESCEIDSDNLWMQLLRLTNRYVWEDSHHFDNPDNFSFCNGKLRMHDYGSAGSQRVIELYGKTIFELFDPSFNYKEDKEKREKATGQ